MAIVKIDKNRFRKVYPGVRRQPVYEGLYLQDIEAAKLTFVNQDEYTYTFVRTYPAAPSVVGSAQTPSGTSQGDVNVFIKEITATQVIIGTSVLFNGTIHVQVIKAV